MTLILSVTTAAGVAMAADSTVTISDPNTGSIVETMPSAANKLWHVKKLSCGVGIWGRGSIRGQDTDKWFQEFLNDPKNTLSITVLAHRLATELEHALPRPRSGESTIGFLICGVDTDPESNGGKPCPVCWHVHDGPSTTLKEYFNTEVDPCRVNANNDVPVGYVHGSEGFRYESRNGDFLPYALYDSALKRALDNWAAYCEIRVPRSSSPLDEANLLAFKIRMISGLYELSERPAIIGGRVDWLAIDQNGDLQSGSLA